MNLNGGRLSSVGERGAAPHGDVPLRHSLIPRLVLTLLASVVLMSMLLFFSIDRFVTGEFRELQRERAERLAAQVRRTLDQELRRIESLARLLVNDTDLINSTYYHLYLEGEKDHPQAALRRVARAFQIEALSLQDGRGQYIAHAGEAPIAPVSPARATDEAGARIVRAGERAWVAASAPLQRDGNLLARLEIARPLDHLLASIVESAGGADVRLVPGDAPTAAGAVRMELPGSAAPALALELAMPDTVGDVVIAVKRLLSAVLAISGLLLAAGFGFYLHRRLRPLVSLSRAASAVGRGEFGQRLDVSGRNEVAQLVRAFNAMAEGLARLRDLERQVQHQEQLSAIGRVAARVAHDLNNPLTVISNAAQLMHRRLAQDGALAEDARLIQHHSERCIRTVENLLRYGRPVQLRSVPLDLGAACADIAQRWRARNDTPVRLATEGPAACVHADPYRLEQMLDNLLDNARLAAPRKEILVTTGAHGGRAFVRVVDAGPGFAPAVRAHLFEPFFTTRREGNGLGLANSLAIARAHGGDIEIGAGAPGCVTVWLPLAPAA